MDVLVVWLLVQKIGMVMIIVFVLKFGSYVVEYEVMLGIVLKCVLGDLYFDELILFGDLLNNVDKWWWQCDLCQLLLVGCDLMLVLGVFLLCGMGGDMCFLQNEIELVEKLVIQCGFLVIDLLKVIVVELIEVCGVVCVIVGVEGSYLVYGINVVFVGVVIVLIQLLDWVVVMLK